MDKKRKIYTLFDKYGNISSIEKEFINLLPKKTCEHSKYVFDELPYIGIIYIPMKYPFVELLSDFEEGDIIKLGIHYKRCKVINVDSEFITLSHWDDHHKNIVICTRKHSGYLLYGNEIIFDN